MAYSDLQSRAFSQIAYMDYLEEKYVDYCTRNGTDTAPLSELLWPSDYEYLTKLGITEDEINSWSISGVHNQNDTNGFYACIIETAPGEAAVAFRGSEDMEDLNQLENDWLRADFGLVNSTCTNQHAEVERFLEKYRRRLDEYDSVTMVGHSLGGNLAEYATIISSQYGLDDNIKQCVSMDGPGFSNEFIDKYRDQIEKMSGVMYHPRWSLAGALLNDLPGVEYQYVTVSNDANAIDNTDYNPISRHDTKYLVYEDGKLVQGEQDLVSKLASTLSQGVDHLPAPIGDALVTITCGAILSFMWAKENFFNADKSISATGWGIIASAVGIVAVFGLKSVVIAVLAVMVAVLAVIAVAFVTELVYDLVMAVADMICDAVSKMYNWAKDAYQQFKEAVVSLINKVKGWFRNTFSRGFKYATANPQIVVDTYKLRDYAQSLQRINERISDLDGRLDSLYWSVGLLDLWNLIQVDLMTGYSWRLLRAASYLNDTASDFDAIEAELTNGL